MDDSVKRDGERKLVDKILGYNTTDLYEILKDIIFQYNLKHIAHVSLAVNKSSDVSLLTAVVTYSKEWQFRYFLKQYFFVDPIIQVGRSAAQPFDWAQLDVSVPETADFMADARRHEVGRQGVTVPIRSRANVCSLVSFTSDLEASEWQAFKLRNIERLEHLAILISDAAAMTTKQPVSQIQLSRREEQCLIWAARGKTQLEIGEILNLSRTSVRTHLDAARHKLHCLNLTHTVGVAVATGLIPTVALRDST